MPVKYSVIVPAAGIGSRFQKQIPKQYALLLGQTVLYRTLTRIRTACPTAEIVLALNPKDPWYQAKDYEHLRVNRVSGGQTRADSVLNALESLSQDPPEWVLVHDAARPCVTIQDIHCLMQTCLEANQGGLLVAPVHDTLKQVKGRQVEQTLNRDAIYRALTPQMFRYHELLSAYQTAIQDQLTITDEASAMEAMGSMPLCVLSSHTNIKITYPHDLSYAQWLYEEPA